MKKTLSYGLILMITTVGLFTACDDGDEKTEDKTVETKTELLCRQWENTNPEGFDITFLESGSYTLYYYIDDNWEEGDGTESTFSWNWTDNNQTAINWEVDDDGTDDDWTIAEVTVSQNELTLGAFSFTLKK